jgi:Smg protein
MWTRLMDLVVLVAEMSHGADRQHVEYDKELSSRGYSSDEIGHAVFWFSSRPAPRDLQRPMSTRVLSEFERMSLSTEACGYLYRLQNLGLIDARQFETIVARAIPMGGDKVGIEDVKSIAYAVIFDKDPGDLEEDVFGGFDADSEPV